MNRRTQSALHERMQSPLALQTAALAILSAAILGLSIPLFTNPAFGFSSRADLMNAKRSQIATLKATLQPMRGVAGEIVATRSGVESFYSNRVSTGYSQITNSLGAIAIKSGVQLAQIQYSEGTPGSDLTEVSMDVGISGSYQQLMAFINGVERDRLFFVIRALSFTGQQGGSVNLRIRISTWLRPPDALEHQVKHQAASTSAMPAGATASGGK